MLALVTASNASSSQLWTIDALGNANPLPGNVLLPFDSEPALQVVPNAAQYGSTLAGKLLVTGDGSNAYTVAVVNGVTTVNTSLPASGLDDAANVAIVPAGGVANVFAAPDQQFSISVAAGAQFAPIWGQILAAHEGSGPVASPALEFIDRVRWDGSTLQSQQLTGVQGPTALQQPWERLAFIPAALGPVPNPLEPGLPNWTIYLDLNNNGTLDAGEPSTLTDANGNYAFTNLQPGNYIVREVPQTGWTERAPRR